MSRRYFKRLEERGYLDELCARYAPLSRYLPTFFWTALPGGVVRSSNDLRTGVRLPLLGN
jgi:hypothetical protein